MKALKGLIILSALLSILLSILAFIDGDISEGLGWFCALMGDHSAYRLTRYYER